MCVCPPPVGRDDAWSVVFNFRKTARQREADRQWELKGSQQNRRGYWGSRWDAALLRSTFKRWDVTHHNFRLHQVDLRINCKISSSHQETLNNNYPSALFGVSFLAWSFTVLKILYFTDEVLYSLNPVPNLYEAWLTHFPPKIKENTGICLHRHVAQENLQPTQWNLQRGWRKIHIIRLVQVSLVQRNCFFVCFWGHLSYNSSQRSVLSCIVG